LVRIRARVDWLDSGCRPPIAPVLSLNSTADVRGRILLGPQPRPPLGARLGIRLWSSQGSAPCLYCASSLGGCLGSIEDASPKRARTKGNHSCRDFNPTDPSFLRGRSSAHARRHRGGCLERARHAPGMEAQCGRDAITGFFLRDRYVGLRNCVSFLRLIPLTTCPRIV